MTGICRNLNNLVGGCEPLCDNWCVFVFSYLFRLYIIKWECLLSPYCVFPSQQRLNHLTVKPHLTLLLHRFFSTVSVSIANNLITITYDLTQHLLENTLPSLWTQVQIIYARFYKAAIQWRKCVGQEINLSEATLLSVTDKGYILCIQASGLDSMNRTSLCFITKAKSLALWFVGLDVIRCLQTSALQKCFIYRAKTPMYPGF